VAGEPGKLTITTEQNLHSTLKKRKKTTKRREGKKKKQKRKWRDGGPNAKEKSDTTGGVSKIVLNGNTKKEHAPG